MSHELKGAEERLEVVVAKAAHLIRWGEGDRIDLTALLASHRKMREALERVRDMRVNKEADTIWSAAARCRDIASSALQGDADVQR